MTASSARVLANDTSVAARNRAGYPEPGARRFAPSTSMPNNPAAAAAPAVPKLARPKKRAGSEGGDKSAVMAQLALANAAEPSDMRDPNSTICTWVLALGADLNENEDGNGSAAAGAKVGLLTWTVAGSDQPSENQVATTELREQLRVGDNMMSDGSCDTVGVLIEGGSGGPEDPWQVSVLPRDPCKARLRFSVDRRLATVAPAAASDTPTHKVTIETDELSEGLWLSLLLAVVGFGVGWGTRRRTSDA